MNDLKVVVVRWDACMGKSRGSRRAGRHLRFDQAGPPEWLPLNALFKTTLTLATMISDPDVASNVGWGLRWDAGGLPGCMVGCMAGLPAGFTGTDT